MQCQSVLQNIQWEYDKWVRNLYFCVFIKKTICNSAFDPLESA